MFILRHQPLPPRVQWIKRPLSSGAPSHHFYHRYTRAKLPGRPGSPEFMAAYAAAERDWAARKSANSPKRQNLPDLAPEIAGA